MKATDFKDRFLKAATKARDFARQFLLDELPDEIRFHVHLNQSYDDSSGPEFARYPEDSTPELATQLKHLAADDVVKVLWRDGLVPQWVNLSVVAASEDHTLVDVVACGRFTKDEARLYHVHEGLPPFHILGPSFPPHHEQGTKFSLFTRSVCWSEKDLNNVRRHADSVWALELGGNIRDESLAPGLEFPHLEILELQHAQITGAALGFLKGCPELRILRVTCSALDRLDISRLPTPSRLEELTLTNLPERLDGLIEVLRRARRLQSVTLAAPRVVQLPGQTDLPGLVDITLTMPRLPPWLTGAHDAQRINLHLESCSDTEVAALLASARASLSSVGLRGTPVTDEIFDTLLSLDHLTYFDLVDTRITEERLLTFLAARPQLKGFPRLDV